MTDILQQTKTMAFMKVLLGFLSTAVFFAAFFLIGDVLIAAIAAIAVAVTQFVLWRTTQSSPGLSVLASLAVVIALTGLSLHGEDTFPVLNPMQVNTTQPDCQCSPKQNIPVRATPVPSYDVPNVVAPPPGRV